MRKGHMMAALVDVKTNLGEFRLQLDEEKAPKTVANFLSYVDSGHYSGTIFHRVIKSFMVQGGGFDEAMKQKDTQDTITNEANNGLTNQRYTIAMARTSDPHSASAQFFINTKDNDFLNHTAPSMQGWGYAVFGEVVSGRETIDVMDKVRTGRKGFHDDVPVDAIIIESMTRVSE